MKNLFLCLSFLTLSTTAFGALNPCTHYATWDSSTGDFSASQPVTTSIDGGFEPGTMKIQARCRTVLRADGMQAKTTNACLVTGISRKTGKKIVIFNDLSQPGSGPQVFQEGKDDMIRGAYLIDESGVIVSERVLFGGGMHYVTNRHVNYDAGTGILDFGVTSYRGERLEMKNMIHEASGYGVRCTKP